MTTENRVLEKNSIVTAEAILKAAASTGGIGRIIGQYVAYSEPRDDLPADVSSIPEGCELRIAESHFIRLFTEGFQEGHRSIAPRPADLQEMVIEAGQDGIVLQGPAVIATYEPSQHLMSPIAQDAAALAPALAVQERALMQQEGADFLLLFAKYLIAAIALSAGAALLGRSGLLPLWTDLADTLSSTAFGLGVLGLTLFGLFGLAMKMDSRSLLKRAVERLPHRITSGETAAEIHHFAPSLTRAQDLRIATLEPGKVGKLIPDDLVEACGRFQRLGSANFIPAAPNS